MANKVKEKDVKKKLTKEEKRALKSEKKNDSFFKGIKKEMKLVRWPLKKEMAKYSLAVLFFMLFLGLYFILGDLIIAGLRTLVA